MDEFVADNFTNLTAVTIAGALIAWIVVWLRHETHHKEGRR